MRYEKPILAVAGKANVLVMGLTGAKTEHIVSDGVRLSGGAYEVDE